MHMSIYTVSTKMMLLSIIMQLSVLSRYVKSFKTRMWANAQRDGRPAEYRWRPLFNAAKFG